jgi:hypothetical protein
MVHVCVVVVVVVVVVYDDDDDDDVVVVCLFVIIDTRSLYTGTGVTRSYPTALHMYGQAAKLGFVEGTTHTHLSLSLSLSLMIRLLVDSIVWHGYYASRWTWHFTIVQSINLIDSGHFFVCFAYRCLL